MGDPSMRHVLIAAIILYAMYIGAAMAFSLQVTWSPNTEIDLAGYNISYDGPSSGRWTTPCRPYEVSSLGVGYDTTFTIEDATVGDYCFYIRAYDTMGNMSECTPYAGTVSLSGGVYTWSTVGVTAPDDCLPEAIIACATTTGVGPLKLTLESQSDENSPDTWEWGVWDADNETTLPDTIYATETVIHTFPGVGTYVVRLRAWNDTWFDDDWKVFYISHHGALLNVTTGSGVSLH